MEGIGTYLLLSRAALAWALDHGAGMNGIR